MILEMIDMFPDRLWTVYSITEDDFIELESLALHCHICPVSGICGVVRDNAFLGVRTC